MKPRRQTDPELLSQIRELPCAACLSPPPNDAHHVKTKGSGGSDEPFNVIPLCRVHHALWHHSPRRVFFERHPELLGVLQYLDWEWDGKKLTHPKARKA